MQNVPDNVLCKPESTPSGQEAKFEPGVLAYRGRLLRTRSRYIPDKSHPSIHPLKGKLRSASYPGGNFNSTRKRRRSRNKNYEKSVKKPECQCPCPYCRRSIKSNPIQALPARTTTTRTTNGQKFPEVLPVCDGSNETQFPGGKLTENKKGR